jgi:hypothetical protein
MHANRAVDVVITLGQRFDISRVIDADADTQKVPNPALTSGIQSCVQGSVVGCQVKAIKVAMGIYEHKKGCNLHRMSGKAGLEGSGQMDFDSTAGSVFTMVELYANPGGLVTPYR